MKWTIPVVLAFTALVGFARPCPAADEKPATHKILRAADHQASEKQLNEFGEDGWRLAVILKAEDKEGGYAYFFTREDGKQATWENKILRAGDHQASEKQLNKFGEDGWRLAVVLKAEDKEGGYLYYLTRKK